MPTAREISIQAALEKAISWLLESGIYVLDQNDPNYGSVYSYYHSRERTHELIYTEATGYLVSLLSYLYSRNNEARLISLARASGDWLVRLAEAHHGVLAMGFNDNGEIRQAFSFDNGICSKGLLDLYEVTHDKKYLACVEQIVEWLITKALRPNGSFNPVLDFDSGTFIEDEHVYYMVSGSFHVKIAMPLLRLYSLNKREEILAAAWRACSWAVGQQKPDGRFPVNQHEDAVKLHFHCYTLEALLYAFAFTKSEEFLQSARKGVAWLLEIQEPSGRFRTWQGRRVARKTGSYVMAQVIRIFVLLHKLNPEDRLIGAAEKTANALVELQASSQDRRINGGFLISSGQRMAALLKRKDSLVSSWATMFGIQALDLLERIDEINFSDSIRWLF